MFSIRCWPIKIPIFKFQLKKSRARLQDSPTMLKSLNPNQLPVPSYLQRTAIKTSFVILILAFAGITQISAQQRTDKILIQGNSAGSQTVQTDSAGVTHVEYSYNDRGRGDHITATWKLDGAGVPTAYEGSGNDYMKAPIQEQFELKNGKAHWKNRTEHGEQSVRGEAFYIPANPPPEFSGVLARALLKAPGHKLSLLPAGEASIEESGKVTVSGASGRVERVQARSNGLVFTPQSIWLDHDGKTAASVSSWFSVVPGEYEAVILQLQEAQEATDKVWSAPSSVTRASSIHAILLLRRAPAYSSVEIESCASHLMTK